VESEIVEAAGVDPRASGGTSTPGTSFLPSFSRSDDASVDPLGRRPGRRAEQWASTMEGFRSGTLAFAHADRGPSLVNSSPLSREERESLEAEMLAPGATLALGAGRRARPEEPDSLRTCFERDRDRILHSSAFRRLAGKTQVFIFPDDHQRTRLTHALEVAQVAVSVAQACRLNVALTEAIALAHDCGHGPGGHSSEEALSVFLDGGFDHAVWGGDVVGASLNLCAETLDGIRNHSWSRPAPSTPEGLVVSWADRIAYCCHDFEDAVLAGIVDPKELPEVVVELCGPQRSTQLRAFIAELIETISSTGAVAMREEMAGALSALRSFNYERVYLRPESLDQERKVVSMLRSLVEHFSANPEVLPHDVRAAHRDDLEAAVGYVAGMTDRFAAECCMSMLGWEPSMLPIGPGGRTVSRRI
jgi:dGTPase